MSDTAKHMGSSGSRYDRGHGLTAAGIAGAAIALAAGLSYFFGWLSEQILAMLLSAAFVGVLGFLLMRIALETVRPALRSGLLAFIGALAAVALYPASVALHLGRPAASATLSDSQKTLALPSSGAYHVLVSGHLGEGAGAHINYRLTAGDSSLEGSLERQISTRRGPRRGTAVQVAENHDAADHDVSVQGAAPALVLDSVTGTSELHVEAFRILPSSVVWALMALVLACGTFLEAKAAAKGTVAMTAAAAVCFGLIIRTANPGSMIGSALWTGLLAAGGGAAVGSILASLGRRVFGAPQGMARKDREPPAKPRAAAAPIKGKAAGGS